MKDDPVTVKWETIRDDGSLVNEPGSGVRLTLECTVHRSQMKNKSEIMGVMRELVGLKRRNMLR